MSTLNDTPSANRLHIAIYGRRNAGKSSLINALTGQEAALVSPVAGTTADPVFKAMEIRGLGACVLIDTAGFDDEGELGRLRVGKTEATLDKADLALIVCAGEGLALEAEWAGKLKAARIPALAVVNKSDLLDGAALAGQVEKALGLPALPVSAKTGEGIPALLDGLGRMVPEGYGAPSVTGGLVHPGDVVMLVMPQDKEAPKGRLILPQVQTIRDLLDRECVSLCVTPDTMEAALGRLKEPPALIITDSQAFASTWAKKPPQSRLTSFSVLFAAYKGDLNAFLRGARAAAHLNASSRVLIAEACTHAPLSEDIGRVKIPALLRRKYGEGLGVDIVSGSDFPGNLSGYDLIVHCGGCMFNRRYLLSRIEKAEAAGVPITNYGVLLAGLNGILDKIALPGRDSVPAEGEREE